MAMLLALAGCSAGGGPPAGNTPGQASPAPPAEPGQAPALIGAPAGQVRPLPGGAPEGIAADPASGLIAIALRNPGRVALVDPATGQTRTLPMPGAARHLVIPRPGELLVPVESTGQLIEVALPQGTVTAAVTVGRQPHDAVRVGDTVFVANEFGRSVGVVRAQRMTRTLPGPTQPGGIAAAAGRVAVADVAGNRLYVYDAATLQQVAVLPAGAGPSHVRPVGHGRVAVADTRGNAVLVYDLRGQPRQVGRVPVPGRAYGLATDPEHGRAFVTLPNTNQVVALQVGDDGSVRTVGILGTVRQPNSVAYDPRSDTVLVAGAANSELQTIAASAL
ncbi:MAG: YncE family protein [Pseudonocardiaceae bacterium]